MPNNLLSDKYVAISNIAGYSAGYSDYEIEDLLKEVDPITLLPMRKKNSKRALPPEVSFVQHHYRKMVETAGSLIEQFLPKSIHAVPSQGCELKVALFVIASSLNGYLNL